MISRNNYKGITVELRKYVSPNGYFGDKSKRNIERKIKRHATRPPALMS